MASSEILDKRKVIRDYVAGRTFVDIGGLWGTRGEVVTDAIRGNASHATMADLLPLDDRWWTAFDEHCAAQGISGYARKQADICAPDGPAQLGTYEFVHCSGVMYHVPDLFAFLSNLRAVTTEYLMISSQVMPATMTNAKGTLHFGPDHAYLAPVLGPGHREIVLEYLGDRRVAGLTQEGNWLTGGRPDTGPWWWLYSAEFMRRIITMYDLEVLAEGFRPTRYRAYTVFARVKHART